MLTDYQIKIVLDESNFDFGKVLADGSDLRVTDSDGSTLIPYVITNFDRSGSKATVWVKVPHIPAQGSQSVYLYYGNPNPEPFDVPPIGSFQKYSNNPVIARTGLLAENIVYDSATGLYWMVYSDATKTSIGAAYSPDLVSWTDYGSIFDYSSEQAPHLLQYQGTWYLYYSSISGSSVRVSVATASSITGPYLIKPNPMISPVPGTWESQRVMEPYVFQGNNGIWYLFYMGDSGNTTEQIGYATASSPLGPWTKSANNPVIPFGPPGSYDAGTVADPFIYEMNGTYYIFYAASSTKTKPWQQAYATTTDMIHFVKHNIVLGRGNAGAWDENNAHRGAISRFGDSYYMSYTGHDGSNYRIGMASMSAKSTASGFPPDQVFGLYDDFSSAALGSHFIQTGSATNFFTFSPQPVSRIGGPPLSKWSGVLALTLPVLGFAFSTVFRSRRRSMATPPVIMTLLMVSLITVTIALSCGGNDQTQTSQRIADANQLSNLSQLTSIQQFGPGFVVEGYIRHADADGSGKHSGQVGFSDLQGTNALGVRDFDNPDWQRLSVRAGVGAATPMGQRLDKNWHLQRIWWQDQSTARFQNDSRSWQPETQNIPQATLPAVLLSSAKTSVGNTVQIGWIRVRQMTMPEPSVTVGSESQR